MAGRHSNSATPRSRRVSWPAGIVVGIVAIAAVLGVVRLATVPRSAGVAPSRTAAQSSSSVPAISVGRSVSARPPAGPAGASAPRIPPLPNGPEGPAHAAPIAAAATAPVHLQIPSIGVDTDLESLALLPDKTLAAPRTWDHAGWYAAGVRPGDPGPAVIAGHVDSVSGPAVFFRLRTIAAGTGVAIRQQSGMTVSFVVDTVREYPKNQFPTEAVYGPTPLPELRLITCTGEFDYATRNYLDNLVVTAHRVA